MRALHFMKIDYMLTRKQLYIVPLFFLLGLMLGHNKVAGEMSFLVASSYLLFVASIFATGPFSYCAGKNKGFLLLFPATVKDRVAGRFLYGLSLVGLLGLLSGVLFGVYWMSGWTVSRWIPAAGLCELAVAIVIIALQTLFFYLFGEGKDNWQYLSNIVRIAPGMALFFGASNMIGEVQDQTAAGTMPDPEAMAGLLMRMGAVSVAAALLLTVIAAAVCVKVIEKRDYA